MYSEPIFGGANTTTAPEYVDVYKQDGTLLFRVDMGYNVRAANDHETTLFAEDFDGDGKSELMLKTALGTRIGNWDEASQSVVYPDTLATVVGGEDGLDTTTEKFTEYFATGDEQALDTYWSLLNSFSIAYRSPTAGGGNDGPNDPNAQAVDQDVPRRPDRPRQGRPGVLLGLRVGRRSRRGRARRQRDVSVPVPGERRRGELGHDAGHPARQLLVPGLPRPRRGHVGERLQGADHGRVGGVLAGAPVEGRFVRRRAGQPRQPLRRRRGRARRREQVRRLPARLLPPHHARRLQHRGRPGQPAGQLRLGGPAVLVARRQRLRLPEPRQPLHHLGRPRRRRLG